MIEVGEYVRTKYGTIHKIVRRDIDKHLLIDNVYLFESYFTFTEEKEDIVKHSKDIIDLIEVGDVVKVKDHDWIRIFNIDDEDTLESFIEDCNDNNWTLLSIVTHEMFESMEYKVEEE